MIEMQKNQEKKVIKKINELENSRIINRLRVFMPISFHSDSNRILTEVNLLDLVGNTEKIVHMFANSEGLVPIEKALEAISSTWQRAKLLLDLESEIEFGGLIKKLQTKQLRKLQEEIDNSEPISIAREYFPIDVSISNDGLLNLGLDLVDNDLGLAKHIDLGVHGDNWVCHVEALFSILSVWEMRHVKKI
ncbi:MAG: hypothetical protein ACOWW1_06310 [archaeon]